jgi:hypothetical protein
MSNIEFARKFIEGLALLESWVRFAKNTVITLRQVLEIDPRYLLLSRPLSMDLASFGRIPSTNRDLGSFGRIPTSVSDLGSFDRNPSAVSAVGSFDGNPSNVPELGSFGRIRWSVPEMDFG